VSFDRLNFTGAFFTPSMTPYILPQHVSLIPQENTIIIDFKRSQSLLLNNQIIMTCFIFVKMLNCSSCTGGLRALSLEINVVMLHYNLWQWSPWRTDEKNTYIAL